MPAHDDIPRRPGSERIADHVERVQRRANFERDYPRMSDARPSRGRCDDVPSTRWG